MGGKQLGFCDYEQSTAKKQTKSEKFLAEIDKVVPWQPLIDLIEPFYPKTGSKGGRPPFALETMLRIPPDAALVRAERPGHGGRPDRGADDATFRGDRLDQREDPRRDDGLDLPPSIGEARPWEKIFETVKDHLKAHGMSMKQGTIIDAALIAALSSTKNKQGERDPEMH